MGINKRVNPTELVLVVVLIVVFAFVIIQDRNNLAAAQEAYSQFQQQVAPIQGQVISLQQQLNTTKYNLYQAQSDVKNLKSDYDKVQAELKLYQDTGIKIYKNMQPIAGTSTNFSFDNATNIVTLNRYPNVHDPTWSELMAFVNSDNTDLYTYDLRSRICGWFANRVFNDAEVQGIRAAFVSIDFQQGDGHAINAFNTKDKGLIYIDCTGGDVRLHPLVSPNLTMYSIGDTGNYDKIAYVQKGKPLGLINVGTSYGLNYSDYQQWQQDVKNMQSKFQAGGTRAILSQLKNESDQKLGSFWESDSSKLVENIEIYW